MFSPARSGPGAVRWLEPVQRRRRRRSPVGPILLGVVLLALAGAAFAFVRARDEAEDPSRAVAQRFADAWAAGDLKAAWRLTTAQTKSEQPLAGFRESYRQAKRAATVRKVRVGRAGEPRDGRVPVPVVLRTRLFGELRGTIAFPVERSGETARVAWAPALRLPGLRPGERVQRRIMRRPRRARVLDADGRSLSREPTAAALVGTAPAGDDPGGGLEALYDDRLGGRPGAELRYGRRRIARVDVVRGRPVKTTVRPSLQAAATRALGDRLGGVAVMRPRTGAVLALAGLAVSGPQPPGSVFKIITLAAALEEGETSPSESFPVRTAATLEGVALRNAGDEACGGTLTSSFAHSCNSVFAPLGARLGAKRLVAYAERFGFNEELAIPAAKPSTIPRARALKDDLAVGASAIGQDRDLATPLVMAGVGATIANGGVRARARLLRSAKVVRRRVVKRRVARQVRDMMLAVVSGGTGTAAALPGVDVAGKTGTAELVPTADAAADPSNTDAWFVAFAPASAPRLAVAVMLVGAGHGGASAAPIAREVLSAGL
jgi:Penicillin binding protein transpeptidase domain